MDRTYTGTTFPYEEAYEEWRTSKRRTNIPVQAPEDLDSSSDEED